MSRERLLSAILSVIKHFKSLDSADAKLIEDDFRRSLAAARAYACERCFGIGEVCTSDLGESTIAGDGWRLVTTSWGDCPDCADYRKIADGGEV